MPCLPSLSCKLSIRINKKLLISGPKSQQGMKKKYIFHEKCININFKAIQGPTFCVWLETQETRSKNYIFGGRIIMCPKKKFKNPPLLGVPLSLRALSCLG